MAKDPEKEHRRAREEFSLIQPRIKAQEALVKKFKNEDDVVSWHDADRQLRLLKAKRQEILRRMG
jgi:hypothetical protein